MADILIKGMEMPRSCQECFWDLGYDSIPNCPDIETSNLNVYLGDDRKGRHPDCPLVEIPDHGDLIDRDRLAWALVAETERVYSSTIAPSVKPEVLYELKNVGNMIFEQPVVIPKGGLGYVSFSTSASRGISAYIDYNNPDNLTWTVIATKTDSGETTGAGSTENALLTDTFGPYSIGGWNFVLEGYLDSTKVYEGSISTTIKAGSNAIEVVLEPYGDNGTLSFENCNFTVSEVGFTPTRVSVNIDSNQAGSIAIADCTTEDKDLYLLPAVSYNVTAGIHTVYFIYHPKMGTTVMSEIVKVRAVPNSTTHISIGASEGTATFSVTVNEEDAIVTE